MRISPVVRVCLLVSLFVAISCSSRVQSAPSEQTFVAHHPIVYGLTLQPSTFDPQIGSSSELGIPLRSVYDTLVYRDPTTKQFVPGLATSWSISPDGLTYTFALRQGVKFHDGTPFNAQAVAANLDRITNPMNASQKAVFLLGPYTGYKIVDDYTIQLQLSAPYSPLLDSLSQVYLGIASPTALSQYSVERYQFHQVGTGPFEMLEYVPGDHLTIRRNFDYAWGPSFYTPSTPDSVDEITFKFYDTDESARATALENKDVDIVGELLPVDARSLTANSDVELLPTVIPGQPLQFMMNTKRFPTNTLAVRQALIYGTNRDAIIDAVFQRFSPVAWGPLSSATEFYSQDVVNSYAFDPQKAKSLLASAGYTDTNNDGYVDFGGANLEVNVITPNWGEIPEVVQLLQDQWRDIGIKLDIDPVPSATILNQHVQQGQYNLVAWYDFGLDPAFLNRYFLSNGASNWTGYSDANLDAELNQAAASTDDNARASLYNQVQRTIMEQALILPIRDYVNLNGSRSDLDGLSYDAYGWFPLLNNLKVKSS
ncbi:MAG TPA: ABC transporter substrate-binding protein [Phototrophicaceae bacterium]|nr:ABC transporter substrate-binding protein [Phototrophicaceae bacterium]